MFKKETKMSKKLWDKQIKQMEEIVKDVEGGRLRLRAQRQRSRAKRPASASNP